MKDSSKSRLDAIRADVDQMLAAYYDKRVAQAEKLHGDYADLWRAMRKLGVVGGKRLRPYLVLTTYEGLGGNDYQAVLPVAVAFEVLHASLLMHDDIIDRDFVRYGRPNVAGQYRVYYKDAGLSEAQTDHYANAAALLAGDLALSGAYELILGSSLDAQTKLTAQAVLSDAIFMVGGGELLDTEAALKSFSDVDSQLVADLKTASYSCVGPLVMGATLAGADDTALETLRAAGRALGIAYQLVDDIIGLFGNEAIIGKSVTSDLEEGKRTYLMQRALTLAGPAEHTQLMDMLGRHVTLEEADVARRIVRDSGALAETEALIKQYVDETERLLHDVDLREDIRKELVSLIRTYITQRVESTV